MIIMARVLLPEDYGLIGMLTIFLAIAQSLVDSGFTQALIRKTDRTETDNSTVFYFNIIVSVVLYAVVCAVAPAISEFYNIPELVKILRVIGLSIVINSFTVVQRVWFTSLMDFKTQAKSIFLATVLSGITGITLAYNGFGVWSIVVQQLVSNAVNAVMLWFLSSWRPRLLYSWNSFREMFSFGSKLMMSGLLDTLYKNIYTLVIGKVFNAPSLGNYTRAHQFGSFPSANLTEIAKRVTYPALCSIGDDDERLKSVYRKFLRLSVIVIFPLMIGLSAVSRPMIETFIGSQWDLCASLLQVLCFSMMWYPVHAINLNLLNVKGRSDLTLRLEILKKIIGIIILCATFPLGLMAMCYGQIVSSVIALFIDTWYPGKMMGMGFGSQMETIFPILLSSFVMYASVRLVMFLLDDVAVQFFAGVAVGAVVYIMAGRVAFPEEYGEFVSLLKEKMIRKNQ